MESLKNSDNLELQEAISTIRVLERRIQDSEDYRDRLEADINSLKSENDELRMNTDQLQSYVTSIRVELSDKQSELDNLILKFDDEIADKKRYQVCSKRDRISERLG